MVLFDLDHEATEAKKVKGPSELFRLSLRVVSQEVDLQSAMSKLGLLLIGDLDIESHLEVKG